MFFFFQLHAIYLFLNISIYIHTVEGVRNIHKCNCSPNIEFRFLCWDFFWRFTRNPRGTVFKGSKVGGFTSRTEGSRSVSNSASMLLAQARSDQGCPEATSGMGGGGQTETNIPVGGGGQGNNSLTAFCINTPIFFWPASRVGASSGGRAWAWVCDGSVVWGQQRGRRLMR